MPEDMDTELVQEVAADAPSSMVVEVTDPKSEVEDAEMSGRYTWTMDGWPRPAKQKVHSEKFEIGTYIWRLLVIPGNDPAGEFLSVFLDSPEAGYTPAHLAPEANFTLVLESTLGREHDHVKESEHRFTSNQADWGFNQFLPLAELADPARGLVHDGGKLVLRVEVKVKRDERLAWDSRKETGYVGLKNQGATCYMNSLLQCLFHLPYFRKAVYHMPTSESDDPSKSMPLALQSVFYKLQYAKAPPSTKDLTKSFGWNTYDAFFQHDVQELNRVLCEKLDDRMKGTAVERSINYLFEGHTESYVACKHVDVRSTKRESFMDIQLVVRGCADVYASFDKYCEVEELTGDNKYRTDAHGLQDAVKGLKFESLPPVLQLHLRRFDYDYQRDAMLKVNDRYAFPAELDLDRDAYLAPSADRSVRNLYRLHSVLVHSGGVHGGHYYAYIAPDGSTWHRFDDERVTKEDARAAIEEQYGGDDDADGGGAAGRAPAGAGLAPGGGGGGGLLRPSSRLSNAYMLVYVRVAQWDDVMCRVTKDDIPAYLRERLEVEQREKEARQRAKAEAHLYCSVRLARDADMAAQVGSSVWFDLVDYDRLPEAASLRVRKHTKFGELKALVAERLGVPVERQRYWTWTKRQNQTLRLADVTLGAEHDGASLMDLREHAEIMFAHAAPKHALLDLRLYLETPWPDPAAPLHKPTRNDMLLFLKHYDPATEALRYVGHVFAPKAARMRQLFPVMRKLAGLPEDAPLACYEEVKYEPSVMVDLVAPDALLHTNAQLETGDILVFQVAGGGGEGGGGEGGGEGGGGEGGGSGGAGAAAANGGGAAKAAAPRFPTVPEFLAYVRDRLVVKFKRLDAPTEDGFTLELLRGMGYADVTRALAERLGLGDPDLLQLTPQNGFSQQPQRAPLKHRCPTDLARILSHSNHATDTLYYLVLDMPLPQLETLKTLRVNFHDERTQPVGEPHAVRVAKDASVGDALEALRRQLPAEHAAKRLRLLEVLHSRIYKVCDPADGVAGVNESYWTLRAEPVPDDDGGAAPVVAGAAPPAAGDLLVHVYHVAPDRQEQQQQQQQAAQAQQQQQQPDQQQQAPSTNAAAGRATRSKQQKQQQPPAADGDAAAAAGDGSDMGTPAPPAVVVPVLPFGEPFLLRIGRTEPLASVKARIRERLGVKPEAFSKWRFCFVPGGGRALPEYLGDDDVPAARFCPPAGGGAGAGNGGAGARGGGHHALGAEVAFLGCEHEDRGAKRPSGHRAAAYGFERPVKINS